jgi:hypothetical protein
MTTPFRERTEKKFLTKRVPELVGTGNINEMYDPLPLPRVGV